MAHNQKNKERGDMNILRAFVAMAVRWWLDADENAVADATGVADADSRAPATLLAVTPRLRQTITA